MNYCSSPTSAVALILPPAQRRLPALKALPLLGLFIAAGLVFGATTARAQFSDSDREFLLEADQGGMTEVQLGQLATQNGTRQDVKDFGKSMVSDHTAINDELKALASQKGLTLPTALDKKHQKMVDKLATASAKDFDDDYISGMVKDHKKDIKDFKDESSDTKDPDVKAFVDKSIPVMQQHLDRIEAMKKRS